MWTKEEVGQDENDIFLEILQKVEGLLLTIGGDPVHVVYHMF